MSDPGFTINSSGDNTASNITGTATGNERPRPLMTIIIIGAACLLAGEIILYFKKRRD